MNPPTAIVADDEPHLSQHLINLLSEVWPDLEVVGTAGNGVEAEKLLQTLRPTIAFLDIRMPKPDGLELGLKYHDQILTVFVTAFNQFAVEAFDQAAVDYLLKPVSKDRLTETVARIRARLSVPQSLYSSISALQQTLTQQQTNYLKHLRVGKRNSTVLVDTNDIVVLRAEHKYTHVHATTSQEPYLLRASLTELERSLDPDYFWRIHRSTIVNSKWIKTAQKDLHGRYHLQMQAYDPKLTVSRAYSHLFKPQ